jgi:CelD/BcsL family acetyltransferase involved in cellulose biosynthesis
MEINDYSDFISLEERWNEVLQRCNHTIFSTWEWLSTWWKHFGNNKKLVLLLAEENDKIIGIAPLMYSVHAMFGLRRGKIEFIGTPHSDYNNFIITGKNEECMKLFIDYLYNFPEKWDCIDLIDIPENAECLPFLTKISKNLKLIHKCPYSPLPESYETFLKSLSSNKRKYIKNGIRRLEKTFQVELVDYSRAQSCAEGMHYLFELHQKRWKSVGFSGAFSDPKGRNFNLDIAKSFSQKNWLSLYILKLSGKPAAADYGFKYQSKYYAYLPGFDPKYSRYSVGNMLRAYMINKFIQEGLTEFDFMRGAEAYKDRWNAIARWNHQAILTRKSTLANVQHRLYNEYWHQGNRLKYLLKMK